MMIKYLQFLFLILGMAAMSCSKSDQENFIECSLSALIDAEQWCGQVFEIFEDEQDNLVINASRKIEGNESDQITIYVPEFKGTGVYQLEAEGAVYRKWCCGDLLLELAILDPQNDDTGQVIIEIYNQQTNEIRGTFNFTSSGEKQINISGNFFGTKE